MNKSGEGHAPHSLEHITHVDSRGVITHYTCNAPKEDVLLRGGVFPVGKKFGCANNREVVKMTTMVVEKLIKRKTSQRSLVLDCEEAMRKLGQKNLLQRPS